LHGNLGTSLASRRPVTDQLGFRLYNTLFLAATTAIIAVPSALVLGIAAAINRNGTFDRIVNSVTLAAISLPEFFIGYLLILAFSVKLGLLPSFSSVSPNLGLGDRLYYIALPTMSLVLVVLAHMMRMTRAAIISVMSYPFIEMAILKGLSPWRVVVQHALPNALAPIINVVAMNLAYLVVGVIVVEVVFVYPGIGQLMVDAVSKRDLPLVQACGLIFSLVYVGLNILADVLAIGFNPQLRRRL
jgi:peptide/nickel transport system permease protein